VFEKEGVKVVTDPVSLPMLLGSTVDFSADMMRSAFTVLGNPNAEGGCGCGVSFNLKS
jgi:iron-sulfur cluster assembly accessory protein